MQDKFEYYCTVYFYTINPLSILFLALPFLQIEVFANIVAYAWLAF